jgi:hypothetical protein
MDGTTKYINLYESQDDGNYLEVPFSNVATVTIDHDWGIFPSVTVLDPSSVEVDCGITHETNNRVIVSFSTVQSGKVILN